MNRVIFSVFDALAEMWSTPFMAVNKNAGLRDFEHMVRDPGYAFGKAPGDYTLYAIGEFDVESGRLRAYPTLDRMICAKDFFTEENGHA